ncbi:MAG: TetR/AcrR family transcriptional regulator [Acidimicrobiia bacterium]
MSTSSNRATPLPRDERRAAILATFVPLLIERGPSVTTKQIADAAGVAEGTIFKAFADKDDLISAAVDAVTDPTSVEQALAAIDPTLDREAQLEEAVALLQRRIVEIWRVHEMLPHHAPKQRPSIEASPGLVAIFSAHRDRIGVEPAVAAQRLRAIALALTHPLLFDEPATPAEIVHQFLHGVSA